MNSEPKRREICPIPNGASKSRKEQEGTLVPSENGFLKRTVAERGSDSPRSLDTPHKKKTLEAKQVRIGPDGASTYTTVTGGMKKEYRKVEDKLRSASIIKEDEEIVGVVEEVFYGSTLQRLEKLVEDKSQGNRVVPVESVEMYEIIAKLGQMHSAKKKRW